MAIQNVWEKFKARCGWLRAHDLYSQFVMRNQSEVPFTWMDNAVLDLRVAFFNLVCGPIYSEE